MGLELQINIEHRVNDKKQFVGKTYRVFYWMKGKDGKPYKSPEQKMTRQADVVNYLNNLLKERKEKNG